MENTQESRQKVLDKQLVIAKRFFKDTPKSELLRVYNDIKSRGGGGPTLPEYLKNFHTSFKLR